MFCSMRGKRLGKIVRQELSAFLYEYLKTEFSRAVSPCARDKENYFFNEKC